MSPRGPLPAPPRTDALRGGVVTRPRTPREVLYLDSGRLRELASIKERQERRSVAELDERAKDELFAILMRGDRPSIGWWRRTRARMAEEAA